MKFKMLLLGKDNEIEDTIYDNIYSELKKKNHVIYPEQKYELGELAEIDTFKILRKWFHADEYLKIEIDTETNKIRIIPVKEK